MTLHNLGLIIEGEGLDGGGKSTQLELLKNRFNCELAEINSPEEKKLRQKIEEITQKDGDMDLRYLYYRFYCQKTSIAAKKIVTMKNKNALKDRGAQTTKAYHDAMGSLVAKNEELDDIETIKPDIVLLFDVDKEERIKRLKKRGNMSPGDKQIIEQEGLLEGISAEYKKFENEGRHIRINTTGRSIEDIHEEVVKYIKEMQQKMIFKNSKHASDITLEGKSIIDAKKEIINNIK